MTPIIAVSDLMHHFIPTERVLDHVSLQVPQGSIYGFLGPNGAGKTTTLKLILGLMKVQSGKISIFGKSLEPNRLEILKRTGTLIESPSLYSQLTALENLEVWRLLYGCDRGRIAEVLSLVGLSQTGDKKAGSFSLGMKQRLAIAIALLPSPSLLILDEPTNGLDPQGMIEMREMLKRFNREYDITILISSHLLSEIDKLVSHVGIINKGRIQFEGTLPELRRRQNHSGELQLETSDPSETIKLLSTMGFHPIMRAEKVFIPAVDREMLATINEKLVATGIRVYDFHVAKKDLETIFMEVIQ